MEKEKELEGAMILKINFNVPKNLTVIELKLKSGELQTLILANRLRKMEDGEREKMI